MPSGKVVAARLLKAAEQAGLTLSTRDGEPCVSNGDIILVISPQDQDRNSWERAIAIKTIAGLLEQDPEAFGDEVYRETVQTVRDEPFETLRRDLRRAIEKVAKAYDLGKQGWDTLRR